MTGAKIGVVREAQRRGVAIFGIRQVNTEALELTHLVKIKVTPWGIYLMKKIMVCNILLEETKKIGTPREIRAYR